MLIIEVNFKKREYIGSGAEGDVYDFTTKSGKLPSGVIKLYNLGSYSGGLRRLQTKYETQSKYPELFAKVYRIRPGSKNPNTAYVVMEKLDTTKLSKAIEALQSSIKKVIKDNTSTLKFTEPYKSLYNRYRSDFLGGMYEEIVEDGNTDFIDFIKENLPTSQLNVLNKLEEYIYKIKNIAKDLFDKFEFLDVHSNNIGIDSSGNIKMFDFVTLSDVKT